MEELTNKFQEELANAKSSATVASDKLVENDQIGSLSLSLFLFVLLSIAYDLFSMCL